MVTFNARRAHQRAFAGRGDDDRRCRPAVSISMSRMSRTAILSILLLAPLARAQSTYAVAAPPPEGFDRARAQAETRRLTEALVRCDTRNPPGNEALAARAIAAAFEGAPNVTVTLLDAGEGRANLIVRLIASSEEKLPPALVLGHLDVVGVQEERWTTKPLEPTEVDGRLYGRGVIDDKGPLAATVVAMLQLAARHDRLCRDVVLLATAGEEGGPPVGIDRVLERHRDLLGDPEFALNEGGRVRVKDGRIRTVSIQPTEKDYFDVTRRATGPSGHGSVPLPDNALAALARACARLHEWRAPVRASETTRLYFRGLAQVEPDPALRAAMLDVGGDDAARRDAAAALLSAREPQHNAVLRSAAALTLLQGGIRANVIPSEGTATFNLRVVPGDDPRALLDEMRRVAAEPAVTLSLDREPEALPPPSPVTTALYRALEGAAKVMAPECVVMPYMSTGATDGAALRAAGIPTYGILPFPLDLDDERRMHGDDERAPVEALGWGAELIYRTLQRVTEP
jgi:acetylornithine deacetylase/succinyl-diaminopimelate desuccinylase-like protein